MPLPPHLDRGNRPVEPQFLDFAETDRPMRRRENQAAGIEMGLHQPASRSCADDVERAGRFVEQPDRPRLTAMSRAIDSRRRCPADR